MNIHKLGLILAIGLLPSLTFAQNKKTAPANWFNLDYTQDGVMGISTEKAYQELLKGRKASPVITAVLDGGVDVQHEDLKDVLWINVADSAQTGTDQDKNGYINDKYGWNFIGNAQGENVHWDNLEVTRLIRKYEPKYISVLPSTRLSEAERREFVAYQKMVRDYAQKLEEAQFGLLNYTALKSNLDSIVAGIGKEHSAISRADLEQYKASTDKQKMALRVAKGEVNSEKSFSKFYAELSDASKYYSNQNEYHLNKDFDPRSIVGDQYEQVSERYYGNADVTGPDAEHGTHVAGIIGANRNNNIGIKGVADAVKIMSVRVVPDGDERDKDVANAIRYAVENGAKVINMSFGKGYSDQKAAVENAIRYAEEQDVLLVHAAGNDGLNLDLNPNYPNKYYTDSLGALQGDASNWITVGATAWNNDADLVASFSNYGYKSVDVFAPGVMINSTMPGSSYKDQQGTSMAAPVVAGLASMLRAYFPSLTAQETKKIIMDSVTKVDKKVKIKNAAGANQRVYLDEISVAGGIVNAYNAILAADAYIAQQK